LGKVGKDFDLPFSSVKFLEGGDGEVSFVAGSTLGFVIMFRNIERDFDFESYEIINSDCMEESVQDLIITSSLIDVDDQGRNFGYGGKYFDAMKNQSDAGSMGYKHQSVRAKNGGKNRGPAFVVNNQENKFEKTEVNSDSEEEFNLTPTRTKKCVEELILIPQRKISEEDDDLPSRSGPRRKISDMRLSRSFSGENIGGSTESPDNDIVMKRFSSEAPDEPYTYIEYMPDSLTT
jgi:hypothetical protein